VSRSTEELLTWCEVSEQALAANLQNLRRRLLRGTQLGVVVKADAYGHGLVLAATSFVKQGAEWLVVDKLAEALTLREAGLAPPLPIYICGRVTPSQARAVARAQADVVVYDAELVQALAAAGREAGRPVAVHLKVESGTHRQGLALEEALALGRLVAATPGVELVGLATHYADIEDTTNHRFAHTQLAAFEQAQAAFAAQGTQVRTVHCANSAATLLWPETHATLVRVGIAAYGLWPSTETWATLLATQRGASSDGGFVPTLTPALAWRARVAQVKEVPEGAWVGYGRTFRATHPLRLAVLPVGYFEGYDRRLSSLAHVVVHGRRAPVRGRVCMNMTMVDVTHIPEAAPGSVATLLGRDGEEEVSADQLAAWMGTINYEVVSRIHPVVPRIGTP
jgi:alanine racemase